MPLTHDLSLDRHAKISSYRGVLESLLGTGLQAIPHRDAAPDRSRTARYLCVRHDVDRDIETALHMARIEHAMGVRASYYLRPPGEFGERKNYYGRIVGHALHDGVRRLLGHALRKDFPIVGRTIHRSARLCEASLEIVALGHEVGLHNDFLQLSRVLERPVPELISEELAFFRDAGVDVTGSAARGSHFARQHGFQNYEIFAECVRPRSVKRSVAFEDETSFELYSVGMRDLGLQYEAYSVRRDIYISDTGSRLFVGRTHYDTLEPEQFAGLVGGASRVVALFHPDWWTPSPVRPVVAAAKASNTAALSTETRA